MEKYLEENFIHEDLEKRYFIGIEITYSTGYLFMIERSIPWIYLKETRLLDCKPVTILPRDKLCCNND